ncbi:MAG: DUF2207 domain-containing protein [Hyphomicrobiales bacterium]|nr:DUF2207 domain-containing protein [Hyphomicrobiales bacterium]
MKLSQSTFRIISLFVLFLSGLFLTELAQAKERIVKYHSDISIETNGDLLVQETITVIAEGNRIRRGIYRDFPILKKNAAGRTIKVGFEVLSVTRNGKDEEWRTQDSSNFSRIYIGNKDVFIPQGLHSYAISYRSDRQLRFFDSHDELYWNVTGTEWEFDIEEASATVTLPANIRAEDTFVFTGPYGSKDKFAIVEVIEQGKRVKYSTTRPLGQRSGLTIGIRMPSGSFERVPEDKELEWFWMDYGAEITSVVVLFLVGGFYLFRWWKVGRDLPAGVIVPRWDVPDDLSPALMNYVENKGSDSSAWKGLTSALLNLAVKGYVELKDLGDKPTITRTAKPLAENLPVGEAALLERLDKYEKKSIKINKSNGSHVKTMHNKFVSAMKDEHRKNYYHHNWGSVALGIIFSVIGLIAILATGGVTDDAIGLFTFVVIVGGMGTLILSWLARAFLRGGSLAAKLKAVYFTAMATFVIFSSGIISVSTFTDIVTQPLLLICLLGIVMANVLFFFLMGAPTKLGREKMDVIEGMKTYLTLAEKDRMNMNGAPKMSPGHYETLLPYAVALGVEKPWSSAFQSWMLTAVTAGAIVSHYSPHWYNGSFNSDNISDSLGNMASDMESSFTASLPVAKSSSSGFSSSGGFSGGGGGGGGGGGW